MENFLFFIVGFFSGIIGILGLFARAEMEVDGDGIAGCLSRAAAACKAKKLQRGEKHVNER